MSNLDGFPRAWRTAWGSIQWQEKGSSLNDLITWRDNQESMHGDGLGGDSNMVATPAWQNSVGIWATLS